MSVLLCVRTNGLAREVGDGVTRFGLQLLPRGGGPGQPPGARAAAAAASAFRRAARVPGVLARPGPFPERAPRRAREWVPAPQPGKPLGSGAQATPPRSTRARASSPRALGRPRCARARPTRAPRPHAPVGTPGSPATAVPGRGLAWAGFASLGAQEDGAPLGLAGPPWSPQESTGDLPRRPVAGMSLPPNQLVGSGLTKVLAGRWALAGQAARPGPSGSPQLPPGSAPRARARPCDPWGQASAQRGGAWMLPRAPRGHPRTAMAHWGVLGAHGKGVVREARARAIKGQRWRGCGAHGQARGMKESLSPGDTGAVSASLPLPRS